MGYPMTRYSLLSKLMRKEVGQSKVRDGFRDAIDEERAMEIHRKFSLYAFVLCDHNDELFREHMTDVFSDLDRHTGKNLLFASLVKSNSDVRYRLEQYYRVEDALTAPSQYAIDDNLYQHALLEAFQMSLNDLPAIVLTTSLESDHWYVIRVADAHQCMHWLEVLKGYADDMADNFPVSIEEVLNKRVSQSTSSGNWYLVEVAPICDLLSAVESAAALSMMRHRHNNSNKDYTRDIFEEVCKRLINYTDDEEKKGIIVSLVKYLQALTIETDIGYPRIPYGHESGMGLSRLVEPETLKYIRMFEILNDNPDLRHMEDHTVLCSLMHKIFESEINASILQLMRKQIRIPMPDFYDKFFPDRQDCYVRNVNLNRYLKGNPKKYVSPGLGNARFAFNVLSEELEFRNLLSRYGISDDNREILNNLWHCISEIRNREAHCQVITDEQYYEICNAVSYVMNNYLPLLFEIKQDLRGRVVLP